MRSWPETRLHCASMLRILNAMTPRSLYLMAAVCSFSVNSGMPAIAADKGVTRLAVRDGRFQVNDSPAFLLGCSYYGALGGDSKTWEADLDDLQRAGSNWIRVWATWGAFGQDISAVDAEGRPREPYFEKLKSLLAECDRRGMLVDVTVSRGNGS